MELNKLSVSIISVLITLAISFGGFCYKNGQTQNELKNIKENQITIKQDLKEDIKNVQDRKAEKEVVDLIFQKMENIDKKLDRLIENKKEK